VQPAVRQTHCEWRYFHLNTNHYQLDDLVATLRNVVDRGKKCTLLIGAGCSVEAGIPTAPGFVDKIKERNPRAYERAKHKTYPHCMAELPPGERRDLIAEFVDEARINWAHISIAQLMNHGFVDRVLTVNFDPLVVRACGLVGEFPAVYDFAASQLFKPADIPDQAVFYLHGQRSGFCLLHTQQEVEKHAEALKPVFEDAGRGRMWIVVGYSGEQDPVFKRLAAVPQFDNELYWITHKDEEPTSQVREGLLRPDSYAFHIKGYDADGFFVKLAQELGCFPPDFVGKPFSHLDRMLELVAPFVPPGQTAKLRVKARDWIADAIARYEEGEESAPSEQDAEQRRSQRSAVAAQEQFLAGDYAKAGEIAASVPGEETKELDAWAHIMEGNALLDQARTKRGPEADRLFAAAGEKYQATLAIKPDMHQALNNWGLALSGQAETKRGAEADELFAAAIEKYQAALAIKPDMHQALDNWGAALYKQAETKNGTEADELFAAAIEKYQAALAIKPDMHQALNSWGATLLNQARTKSGAEADELYRLAAEKLSRAEALAPGHVAYNLACLAAVRDRQEEALSWLVKARAAGTLPERTQLDRDPDLDGIRDTDRFQAFLASLEA